VICPSCKHEFPDADPKSPYYDPDRGIIVNGKEYYLKGVWNAWVVDQMSSSNTASAALDNLGYAYALTGDERYAHKAMVIMDALATVAPTTIGPRDFQSSRESLEGRFHYLTSIVYRVRMNQLGTYDLIGKFSELNQPSPTNPGLTYAENIKKNLLEDYLFLHFDVRNMNLTTLHNHEGDSVRAMLGVGLVTGNPDYIRWGLESLFYFIDNTVDRDGQYYETSASYSQFSASVLCDMAELAASMRSNPKKSSGSSSRVSSTISVSLSNMPSSWALYPELTLLSYSLTFGNTPRLFSYYNIMSKVLKCIFIPHNPTHTYTTALLIISPHSLNV
jgi:hypothetical protein